MCLLSTRVQPSLLPVCKTAGECEKELIEYFPAKTYQHVPAGVENVRARKGIVGAWSAIQRATQTLEQIKQSCTTLNAGDLLARAIVSASELQNVLKTTEEAQEFTYRALEKSIVYGAGLELERVKDTKSFEAYAKLLQNAFELQTQNPTSEWSQNQKNNQAYFEQIARTIAQNKAGAYRVEWSSVFDAYRTGVTVAVPENARVLFAVSPLWQGALGAFLGKYSNSNALGIVSRIQANEVIAHAEQVVAPENGLVIQIWKNIREFDDEMSAMYVYEKGEEENASKIIVEALSRAEENDDANQKWAEAEESMKSWVEKSVFSAARGEHWKVSEEWSRLEAENRALRASRVHETKTIGQRIAERRELNRKIEDVKKKMNENEEKNAALRKQCEQFLAKNNLQGTTTVLDAENCLSQLNEAKQFAIEKTDAGKISQRAELNWCVQALNEVERALEREETRAEDFEHYFGSGSVNACESARMNHAQEYENLPLMQEWNEKREKMAVLSNAILRAGAVWDWSGEKSARERVDRARILTHDEEPAQEGVQRERIQKMDDEIFELEESLREIMEVAGNQLGWKVTSPVVVRADEEQPFDAEGIIENVWGGEIDFPFVIGMANPGVESISVETSGISAQVSGDEIIMQGDYLPGEKIVLRGSGNGVLARANNESVFVKLMGERAAVTQHLELFAEIFPATIRVNWNAPAGIVNDSVSIWADGKRVVERGDTENSFEIDATAQKTKISITYETEHAVATQTRIKSQLNEWGRVFIEYEIAAQNSIAHDVRASIFTGVSGDPVLTESIRVTNENGENVPYTLDAVGNVVLSNQLIEGNGRRTYAVRVERNDSVEEWISLGARLRLDIDALARAENSSAVLGALKLKNKLNSLQKEKDVSKIAEKLIEIQMEASTLWMREEEYQSEWSTYENEWNATLQLVDGQQNKWVVQGNAALANRNKQKLVEAIQKISEAKKMENKNTVVENTDEEKSISAAKNAVMRALENIETYERALSVGCEKLLQVNFSCPIDESEVKNVKKQLSADKKLLDKMEAAWKKILPEARGEEWKTVKVEWERLESDAGKTSKLLEDAVRVLRNAAVERTTTLKRETAGSADEDVVSSVEKAALNIENGEFGKSIFVAQSVLNYVQGSKITGLVSIPLLAWPFLGVMVLMGGWLGWNEWKKKNKVEIPMKTVPRAKEIMETETNTSASAPPPTREALPRGGTGAGGRYMQVRPGTLAHSEKEMPLQGKNPKMRRRKGEPHSLKEA